MFKPLVWTLLFITLYSHSFAQTNANRKLDSLTALIPSAAQDTNKVLLLAAISLEYFQTDPDKSKSYGEQVLELATQLKYDYGIIKGHNLIARCYGIQNNFPEALNHYQAALAKARELNNPKMIAILSVSLGAIYSGNNEFDKAYKYLMDAKDAFAKAGITNTVSLMTNLGVLYSRQNKYAEALQYYEQGIIQQEATGAVNADLATLYSNAGGMHLALHDYNQALNDLFKALAIQQNLNNTKSIAFIYSNIGNAYRRAAALNNMSSLPDSLQNKNILLKKALYFTQQSLAITEDMGIREISLDNYSGLSDIYSMLGNDKEAYTYLNKYTQLKDSLRDIKQEKEFARIEAEFNVKKTTDSLKYLTALKDEEARQRKLERNSLVSAITLIGIITALLINRQKQKQVQKRKIAEAEKNKAEEYAHAQLEDFKQRIQEKNQLIETITAEIDKYKEQNGTQHTTLDYTLLKELEQAILLTDEQWDAFKNTFDKVHIGYIIRLKEKMPDISPAETRFMVLSKLKLSNKEMAGMLGVTPQAMRTNKYRLMKKLGIEDDELLERLIQTI
jgi:tetratricopeptide (TPR) repeat protein